MLYLIGSLLFYSVNNVLWAHYAPKVTPFKLIGNRALFTTIFMGLILIFVGLTQELSFQNSLLEILFVSIFGFIGLLFLVLGFKNGTVLQFSVYSLLLTFVLGFLGNQSEAVSLENKLPEFGIVCLGYLSFVLVKFKNEKSRKSYLGHLYFILANLCFGVLLYLQWNLLDQVSSSIVAFFQELIVFVFASLIWLLSPTQKTEEAKVEWWRYALFALPISLAVLLGLEGLKFTHPFHSALMSLLTPMTTVLLAAALGLERLQWKPMTGFIIILIGLSMFYF